jgi:hypothetical protein
MKRNLKLFLLFSVVILTILLSCSVNSRTGVITINNQTDTPIYTVRVGGTLLALYVAPGSKVDYWLYNPIAGQLTFNGGFEYPKYYKVNKDGSVDTNNKKSLQDIKCEFDLNHWNYINAVNTKFLGKSSKENYIYVSASEHNNLSPTSYDYTSVTENYTVVYND